MRVACKVLAIISMGFGTLLGLAGLSGGGRGELAAFVGAVLFGSGLISLTILACSEPRWPTDEERRRRAANPYTSAEDRFEDIS
jgi:hypothetical protein